MGGARFRTKRLGEKLRQIRDALGLSQSEMLRRLGFEDELWYTQVSAYETGRREPPLIILLEYARAANVSTDFLIDDELDLPARLPKQGNR
ncbi:MAG: Helix-turn-helix domain [Acidobacteriota bacterium]|jgi:transcriptional regulator with XRE-family HTH domain|nr:Helix-turn-helix domain [Acidobacteriota bacterium]